LRFNPFAKRPSNGPMDEVPAISEKPEKGEHVLAVVDVPWQQGNSTIHLPPVPPHRGNSNKAWNRAWELEVTAPNGRSRTFDFRS